MMRALRSVSRGSAVGLVVSVGVGSMTNLSVHAFQPVDPCVPVELQTFEVEIAAGRA